MRDDQQLRHYLLGGLSETEMEGLEQRLLREDELFELAEAIESELLEEYAHGDLSPRERGRVARRLAASPAGDLRLAVIRGLSLPADATSPARVLPFERPAPPRPEARPEFRISAIAAMLAILVGAGWLASQRAEPPKPEIPGRAQKMPEHVEPRRAPAQTGDTGERVAQATPTPTPTPPPPARSLTTAVLQIAMIATRGLVDVQQLTIPKRTDLVELQFLLAAGDEVYPSYRLTLIDADGDEVASGQDLRSRKIASDNVLALTLKAPQLPEGGYTAEIRGLTAEGEAEDLAFQEFQIHVNK